MSAWKNRVVEFLPNTSKVRELIEKEASTSM